MKLFTIVAMSVFAMVAFAGAEAFDEIALKIQASIDPETGTFTDGAHATLLEAHSLISDVRATTDQEIVIIRSMNNMVTYNLACIDALAGNTEEAIAWLQESVDSGYSDSAWMLQDEDLSILREDPRFTEISEIAAMNGVESSHDCGNCPNRGGCGDVE